jgi:hypothetical protein
MKNFLYDLPSEKGMASGWPFALSSSTNTVARLLILLTLPMRRRARDQAREREREGDQAREKGREGARESEGERGRVCDVVMLC